MKNINNINNIKQIRPIVQCSSSFALVERFKRGSSLLYQLFPINHRIKYPVFFEKLLERINNLKLKNNDNSSTKTYLNVDLNRKLINSDLKNKGGIYLWWCENTGLFYIGSAKSFVGKTGRLNEYFQKNRLLNTVKAKISSDIAKDMLNYPKSNWNLIILEVLEGDINLNILKEKEQFWMLLIPTYNRSLVVGSNEGLPLSEEKRESISTLIHIYEISSEGKLIPNSEQKIHGIKELSRIGIKSKLDNLNTTANIWDIQAHVKSGVPFKNRFLLLKTPLTVDEQLNWTPSPSHIAAKSTQAKSRVSGVWVYDFNTLNLIEYLDSVKLCREKYNIPSTTFKRIRIHRLDYKGLLFSNNEIQKN